MVGSAGVAGGAAPAAPTGIQVPNIGWGGQVASARVALHEAINDRRTADVRMSYVWLVLFLLAPTVRNALGIFAITVFLATFNIVLLLIFGGITLLAGSLMHGLANRKMIVRMTRHFDRESRFRSAAIDYLYARGAAAGALNEMTGSLLAMAKIHGEAEAKDRGRSTMWAFIVALPLIRYYFYWFISKFPYEHEQRWLRFIQHMEHAGRAVGVTFTVPEVRPARRHRFWVYLALSVVTSELFLVYWYYLLIRDPHQHFKNHEWVDDAVMLAYH